MKATAFKNAPRPKSVKQIKSRVVDGKCLHTGKKAYYKKKAERLAAKWKPDERGDWEAYKCPYGNTHWHLGHATINNLILGGE